MHNYSDLRSAVNVANYLIFIKRNSKLFAKSTVIPAWENISKSLGMKIKKVVMKISKDFPDVKIAKNRYTRYKPNEVSFHLTLNIENYLRDKIGYEIYDARENHSALSSKIDEIIQASETWQRIADKYSLVETNKHWREVYMTCIVIREGSRNRDGEAYSPPVLSSIYEDEILGFCAASTEYAEYLCLTIKDIIEKKLKSIGKKKTKENSQRNEETKRLVDLDIGSAKSRIEGIMMKLKAPIRDVVIPTSPSVREQVQAIIQPTPRVIDNIQARYDEIHRRRLENGTN